MIVVVPISYFSLVLGELVPKSLALRYSEQIACFVARPIELLARTSAVFVKALTASSNAVLRLLDSAEPNPPAYNLLCRYLALLDGPAAPEAASLRTALSFRLKLALTAGFSPELASCARCGEAQHLVGFSGAAGGVVCASCEGGSFPLSEGAHRFMVEAIASPLAEAPEAGERELAQAERAIGETLEHHAHVQLRSAA